MTQQRWNDRRETRWCGETGDGGGCLASEVTRVSVSERENGIVEGRGAWSSVDVEVRLGILNGGG